MSAETSWRPFSRTSVAAVLIAAFALSGPLRAEEARNTTGTPIAAHTLIDHAEMIRIADAIDAAVDAKNWAYARSFFTDEIRVDFTSLTGGDPATIPADALIAGWQSNLTAEKASFHLRGNHQITFEGEGAATMISHGYAWNRIECGALPENGGEALWEVWGNYEHRFIRMEDAWRVNAMSFFATAERGSKFVRNTPGR